MIIVASQGNGENNNKRINFLQSGRRNLEYWIQRVPEFL